MYTHLQEEERSKDSVCESSAHVLYGRWIHWNAFYMLVSEKKFNGWTNCYPVLSIDVTMSQGMNIKYVQFDNAGENRSLDATCNGKDWKMVIQFEYTACDTPQQNHLADIGIYVLCSRGRALISCAKIPYKYRYRIFIYICNQNCLQTRLVASCRDFRRQENEVWWSILWKKTQLR